MRTPHLLLTEFENSESFEQDLEFLSNIQKEAWNEAIDAAIKVVKYNQKTNKELISKLKK